MLADGAPVPASKLHLSADRSFGEDDARARTVQDTFHSVEAHAIEALSGRAAGEELVLDPGGGQSTSAVVDARTDVNRSRPANERLTDCLLEEPPSLSRTNREPHVVLLGVRDRKICVGRATTRARDRRRIAPEATSRFGAERASGRFADPCRRRR